MQKIFTYLGYIIYSSVLGAKQTTLQASEAVKVGCSSSQHHASGVYLYPKYVSLTLYNSNSNAKKFRY